MTWGPHPFLCTQEEAFKSYQRTKSVSWDRIPDVGIISLRVRRSVSISYTLLSSAKLENKFKEVLIRTSLLADLINHAWNEDQNSYQAWFRPFQPSFPDGFMSFHDKRRRSVLNSLYSVTWFVLACFERIDCILNPFDLANLIAGTSTIGR